MKIVFYDTETSGTDPQVHEIIQIAAAAFEVRGDEWQLLESFERKMLFNTINVALDALLVNSFNADTWEKEAVTQKQGLLDFDSFVKPHKDVWRNRKADKGGFYNLRTGGHNIVKFDDVFVRKWYKTHGKFCPFDYMEVYDTLQLAKWRIGFGYSSYDTPADWKLGTLCEHCNVPLEGAHDALADVMANARLAWRLLQKELKFNG